MIVVAAPAGYGKTTLLADWTQMLGGRPAAPRLAWVSLDPGDDHPVRFWQVLMAALEQQLPGTLGNGAGSYMANGKQYIVLASGGGATPAYVAYTVQ